MQSAMCDLMRAFENNNIGNIKKSLQKVGIGVYDKNDSGWNCFSLCYRFATSTEAMTLVLEKIIEAGGPESLESQLAANCNDKISLMSSFLMSSSLEVVKLLSVVLFALGHFERQHDELDDNEKKTLKEKTGIDSSSWTPDPESLAEVETLLYGVNIVALKNALHNNQHSLLQESFENNNLFTKKILNARVEIIMKLACSEPKTPLETMMNLFFSEIKRIGGDEYVKQFLAKENTTGETCLLAVCLRYPERLGLFLDAIEKVGGEDFLIEQIAKKRQRDRMSCLLAVCKSAPKYDILSLFVSKIFNSLGRRFLNLELDDKPCLNVVLSREFDDQEEERKFLCLMVSLYSMTGIFEEHYLRLDTEQKREMLRRICKIEAWDWSRVASNDSSTPDVIGEIKKSIKSQNNNKSSEEKAATTVTRNIRTMEGLNYNDPAVLRALFNEFDYNGDGVLSCGEILPMMLHFFKKSSPAELQEKIRAADTNSDGMITFDEFSQLVKTTKKMTDEEYDLL